MDNNSGTRRLLWRSFAQGFALALMVALAYLPVLMAGFLWDDSDNVVDNLFLRTFGGLKHIWLGRGAAQQYYPLSYFSYWVDYHLWGLNPMGYHAENVFYHALVAILLWQMLKLLKVPVAWFGAALFALHPVCVESVAWVTERRNMLSAVFILAFALAVLKFWLAELKPVSSLTSPSPSCASDSVLHRWKFYLLALIFFVCALWSKTAFVGAPVIVLLLVWWKRGRLVLRDLLLIAPFLLVGIGMSLITIYVESRIGSADMVANPLPLRAILVGRNFWFYLQKLIWPHPLMIIYPFWRFDGIGLLNLLPLLGLLVLFAVLWFKRDSWGRPALVAFGCFALMLFPVLGLFRGGFFRFAPVSDHFQYMACMAPLALLAAMVCKLLQKCSSVKAWFQPVICGLILFLVGMLSREQSTHYLDEKAFWQEAVRWNPDSWIAQNNLGLMLANEKKWDEAMEHLNRALVIKPQFPEALNNQGLVLTGKGEFAEGIRRYGLALLISSNYVPALYNIGTALIHEGKPAAAVRFLTRCARQIEGNYRVQYSLGIALATSGNPDEAIVHFDRAISLYPGFAPAYRGKGAAFLGLKTAESMGNALNNFAAAIQLAPSDADGRCEIAIALYESGMSPDAIQQLQQALVLNPRLMTALKELAWILATDPNVVNRNGNEAVKLAEQAKPETGNPDATTLATLAAAYAEAGRFSDALDTIKNAEALSTGENETKLLEKIRKMEQSFAANQPYRANAERLDGKPFPN